MNQTETLDLAGLITVLCSHPGYKKADGSPCTSLADIESTPQFQAAYNRAMKRPNGNATNARYAALVGMSVINEELAEVPAFVLHPADTHMRGKGKDATPQLGPDGTPAIGVRVALADGRDRFLSNVPADVQSKLSAGDRVMLKGSIKHTKDLKPGGKESMRIGKDTQLVPTTHNEPWPRMGCAWEAGPIPRSKWAGAYYVGKNGTITGTFGKNWPNDNKHFMTVTLNGCGWANDRGVGAFCVDGEGFEGIVHLTKDWIAENLGIPASDDRDTYREAFVDAGIELLVCGQGDVRRKLFTEALGGKEALDQSIKDLRNNGLLVTAGKKEILRIPENASAEMVKAGMVPYVEIGDQRVVGIEVKGDWVDVWGMPEKPGFEYNCIEQELPKNAGGTWVKNEGFFAVPLGSVEDAPLRIDEDDPIYRQLQALSGQPNGHAAPPTGTAAATLHV